MQLKKKVIGRSLLTFLAIAIALPSMAHTPAPSIAYASAFDRYAIVDDHQQDDRDLVVIDRATLRHFESVSRIELPAEPIASQLETRIRSIPLTTERASIDVFPVSQKLALGSLEVFEENNLNEHRELGLKTRWALGNARARWYDPSTGTFLSPDPLLYRDSSNLYAFAGGDPVNGRDPSGMGKALDRALGVSDWLVEQIVGGAVTVVDPFHTLRNAKRAYDTAKAIKEKRVQAELTKQATEFASGLPGVNVYVHAKAASNASMAHDVRTSTRERLSTGVAAASTAALVLGSFVEAVPAPVRTAPRVNLVQPRPQLPIEQVPGAVINGQRVYKIPPGSTGGDTAYQPIAAADRARFFDQGTPLCSYCRFNDARPVDHVSARSRAGNREPENLTPACDHCNPSKRDRPAPKNPPPGYVGEWPPSWWPQTMRSWWEITHGEQ